MPDSSGSKKHTPGSIGEFFSIAYPLIISNASVTIMHFVDRLFLSWSSPEEIAACIPAGILHFTILSFFLGICEYTNTFVAQFYGAKRYHDVGRATWQGIWFAILCGIFCLLLIPLGNIILDHTGHSSDIIEYEKVYFTTLLVGGTFFLLKESLASFYSGRGKTKVIMITNIIANLLNGFLDYALIFGHWGFPKLGIQGAAIATVCATAFICLIFLILFLDKFNAKHFYTRITYLPNQQLFRRLLWFGAPSGAHFFLEIGCFTVFVFLIGQLGKVELAASNIVLAINSLAWFPMIGAGVATTALVGQYIGKKDYDTAEKCAYTAFISMEIYMLFFACLYFLFPDQFLSLFQSKDPNIEVPFAEIQLIGTRILLLVAIYQVGDAMIISFSSTLRGAGDTFFAMWANIIFGWGLFVPGTWFAIRVFDQGVVGAWIWGTIYIILLGSILFWRFRSGVWKTIQVIPPTTDQEIPAGPVAPADTPSSPESRMP
jgi:MATE family multidrug resistance protein